MTTPTPAQLNRMMGGEPKWMAIIWASESREDTMYCVTGMPNPKLTWLELPLLSKLGVNKVQYAKPSLSDRSGLPNIVHTRNITMEIFSMDCDPASPTFGTPGFAAHGQILLRRGNPRSALSIMKSIIEPLELFIEERLAAIKDALPDQAAAKLQYEQLNPKAYKQFFKAYRAEQASKYSGLGWEKTACPVELVTPACEGCGVDETPAVGGRASSLKKCAKCMAVSYCNR